MKLRREPAIARWLLNLFCSSSDHDSVIGDLMEQYQQGRGRTWYWRQAAALSLLGLYSKIARRPLIPAHRFPVGLIVVAFIGSTALATALFSDIGLIFLTCIVAGVCVGIFRFVRGEELTQNAKPAQVQELQGVFSAPSTGREPLDPKVTSNGPRLVRIDSSHIPVAGGIGAGILILILMIAVLHDVPYLRRMAIPGLLAGLFFAACLRLWRRWHPRTISKDWLSIKR